MVPVLRLRASGSPLTLRLSALTVLLVAVAGLSLRQMPAYEAGRLYLVALGLYLIAPAEVLEKSERRLRLLFKRRRFMLGTLCITFSIALVGLQMVVIAL